MQANQSQQEQQIAALNSLILDHLAKMGLTTSAKALKDELANQAKNLKKPQSQRQQQQQQDPQTLLTKLQSSFDTGNKADFFSTWEKLVPKQIKENEYNCKKLEFNLHIYFVVYVMHPYNKHRPATEKELRKEQAEFKQFLDTKGSDLSKTSEFLAYYALPYIPNPMQHPSFQSLFTMQWVADLKGKIKAFIQAHAQDIGINNSAKTQLLGIFTQAQKSSAGGGQDEDIYDRLQQMQKTLVTLQKKEQYAKKTLFESQVKWTNFSGEIVKNCKELILVLEQKGIKQFQVLPNQPPKQLEQVKQRIMKYDSFLQNNAKELSAKGANMSQFGFSNQQQPSFLSDASSIKPNDDDSLLQGGDETQQQQQLFLQQQQQQQIQQKQLTLQTQSLQSLAPLDYDKLKAFFLNSRDEIKLCATLQALRWRVTRVTNSVKRQTLHSFAHFDILDVSINSKLEKRVFDYLYFNQSNKVREFTMSFLNALASEYLGRSYLLQRQDIVKILVSSLYGEGRQDTYLRQNTLGTLQKFSLRKEAQNQMIQFDVIKWIIETIKDELESLSDYTLEYATALLMNLSLRVDGKNKCQEIPEILTILNELIESENLQVRTHVNGTLYSILTRNSLKQQAHQLGMHEMLEYLMQNSDEQFQRQIQYILNQLNAEGVEEEKEDENEIEDEEEDDEYGDEEEEPDQEEDGEYNDTIKIEGVPVGEELLTSQFILPTDEAMTQTMTITKRMEEQKEQRLNHSAISKDDRPVTGFGQDNPFNRSRMGYANPAHDRGIPSAMKSRPRIPRTPDGGSQYDQSWRAGGGEQAQHFEVDQEEIKYAGDPNQDNPSNKTSQQSKRGMQARQIHGQQPKDGAPDEVAFMARDKIPRTPYKRF